MNTDSVTILARCQTNNDVIEMLRIKATSYQTIRV